MLTFGMTPRKFTTAMLSHNETPLLEIQASSAISLDGTPHGCLRYEGGDELPGSSRLWIHTRGPTVGNVSVQLDRTEVAELAGVLLRWLATGFVEGEKR